ncbi:MAG TPA: MFS transporter [Stellaceae bacterium]|nr:MFS transporter [Stellaceae bacterium]
MLAPLFTDRRRIAVILCGLCSFLDLWATQSLLPLLADRLHASPVAVSFTVSMPPLAIALVAPWTGIIADVFGRKRVIVAAMFALVVPTVMVGFATTLGAIIVWRFVQGLFVPSLFATTVAYIADECPPGEATAITGLYTAAGVFGGFLSRFLTAFLAAHWGWRAAFLGLALLTLCLAVGVVLTMPAERGFKRSTSLIGSTAEMMQHFRDSRLVATYSVGFCALFTFVTIFTFVGFRLAAPPYRLSTAALGAIFVTYLAGVVTTPLIGRGVAWLGRRRMVLIALAIWAGGLVLTLLPSMIAIIAGLMIAAAFGFACQAASTSYVALTAQRARSSAVGLYVTFYYLGGSVGGVIAGLAWTFAGWPGCVAAALAVLGIVALVVRRYWEKAA